MKSKNFLGMLCAYKKDIEKVGGFKKNQTSWGEEDLDFAIKVFTNVDLKLIRYFYLSTQFISQWRFG